MKAHKIAQIGHISAHNLPYSREQETLGNVWSSKVTWKHNLLAANHD